MNLFSNALKFTLKGYIKIKVQKIEELPVEIDAFKVPLMNIEDPPEMDSRFKILISVEDTGLGIKDSDKNKLFKMFGTLKATSAVNP